MIYNNFQFNVRDCIDDRLADFVLEHHKSLSQIHKLYNDNLDNVALLYRNPIQYYTRIMVIAYKKTVSKEDKNE